VTKIRGDTGLVVDVYQFRITMKKLHKGDYVLATKYQDGDPKDHFCVGFFNGMLIDNKGKETERYMVIDGAGANFRGNGFRRCEKIRGDVGELLVIGLELIQQGCASVWYWRYHPKRLKELIEIR